ncbi:hypothetical protein GQ457_16G015430 [Hibiscus cannabinus]
MKETHQALEGNQTCVIDAKKVSHWANLRFVFLGEYKGKGVLYHCGLKCPMWTTWKRKNPGRRFFNCLNFKNSDCKFFRWHDEDMDNLAFCPKFLIYELKKENEELNKVNQSNEQFEVQQMKLELQPIKKHLVLADEHAHMIRREKYIW